MQLITRTKNDKEHHHHRSISLLRKNLNPSSPPQKQNYQNRTVVFFEQSYFRQNSTKLNAANLINN